MSIRQYNQDWEGEVGTYSSEGSGDFVKYDTPAHSIRAGDRLLRTFQRDAGVDTIRKAISKYAPPKGDDGYTNPTNKYIEYVSQQSGIDPDEPLDFEDPVTRSRLVSPMAFFESNTVLTPEQVRSTIASIDEDYANTLPQLPTVGEGATRAEFMRGMTGPARTKELIESVESGIPVSSVGRDASRKEFMTAMMASKAIPNAVGEDAAKTKESDVQSKEAQEGVSAFKSKGTSIPTVIAKEDKKVDLFAGARKADKLLNAYMPDPLGQFDAERAAALVDSIGEGATRKEFMAGMTEKPYMPDPLGQFDAERAAALVDSVGEGATRKEFMAGMTRPYMPDLLSQIEKEKKLYEKQYMPDPLGQFEAERAELEGVTQDRPDPISMAEANRRASSGSELLTESTKKRILERIPPQYRRMMQDTYMERHGVPMPDDVLIDSYLQGQNTYKPPADERSIAQKIQEAPQDARERYRREVEEDPLALSGKQQKRIEQGDDAVEAVKKQLEEDSKATTATAKTDQQLTDQAVSGARATSSGDMYDLMREIAGTREQAKKEAFANAMIQLGAGVASGNLAAGLSAAGKAASETMSDYRDRALKGRLAELQLKKADIQEARYARSEDLAERREKRYLIAAANESIKEQTDNLLVKVGMELEAQLGRTPTDAEIANAMEDARQRIIDAAATTYGLDRRLLGGVSVTPEEEDDDAPTTQYQTDPSAPKLVDVN
tara:strand:+ start:1 stop:2160 length:2160 start_codon:yes stop_codon:yes gene_type:complete